MSGDGLEVDMLREALELMEGVLEGLEEETARDVPTLIKHCTRAIAQGKGKHKGDWGAAYNICKAQMTKYKFFRKDKDGKLRATGKGSKTNAKHAWERGGAAKTAAFNYGAKKHLNMEALEEQAPMVRPVRLEPKLDRRLYQMLIALYEPFLTGDPFLGQGIEQYLARDGQGQVVGVASLDPHDFVQIALLPDRTGQGWGASLLVGLMRAHGKARVDLVTHRDNLPVFQMIQALGGGFYEKQLKAKVRKGFLRLDEEASPGMRRALTRYLGEAGPGYERWLQRYEGRGELRDKVLAYAAGLRA